MIWQVIHGDCLDVLATLPDESVQCCVTSPPYYGLRDYGVDGQIGLEPTPDEYVSKMVSVFREVRRVLKSDGNLWLNIGDSYASYRDGKAVPDTVRGDNSGTLVPKGSARNRMASTFDGSGVKHKDLIGIPWMLAFALRADGWWLRQDIIWHKPNPMPESVQDRCTKAHEYVFLLSKSDRYFYDNEAVREDVKATTKFEMRAPKLGDHRKDGNYRTVTEKVYDEIKGANRRSVWSIPTKPSSEAHFAVMPPDLARICILAGSRVGDIVLDPFTGAGTTGMVALKEGRGFVGSELNPDYCDIARKRISAAAAQGNLFHHSENINA